MHVIRLGELQYVRTLATMWNYGSFGFSHWDDTYRYTSIACLLPPVNPSKLLKTTIINPNIVFLYASYHYDVIALGGLKCFFLESVTENQALAENIALMHITLRSPQTSFEEKNAANLLLHIRDLFRHHSEGSKGKISFELWKNVIFCSGINKLKRFYIWICIIYSHRPIRILLPIPFRLKGYTVLGTAACCETSLLNILN